MLLGHIPDWCFKKKLVELVLRQCFRITAACLPMIRRFHNTEYRPTKGICVCNHTSPLDVLVLMCDANYSLTGQVHTGILGVLQRALSRVSHHMWFDRKELADREALGLVLRLHCSMKDRPPVLLFPEGTCINNTAVMQFKRVASRSATSFIQWPFDTIADSARPIGTAPVTLCSDTC